MHAHRRVGKISKANSLIMKTLTHNIKVNNNKTQIALLPRKTNGNTRWERCQKPAMSAIILPLILFSLISIKHSVKQPGMVLIFN